MTVETVSELKYRAAPITILQTLRLVEEVIPLSNFYFKVSLAQGITDDQFLLRIRQLNDSLGFALFGSVFDGVNTTDLFSPKFDSKNLSVLILEDPPRSARLDAFKAEGERLKIPTLPCWGTGPSGTCVVWSVPSDFNPPSTISVCGISFKLSLFRSLPPSYDILDEFGEDDSAKLIRDCFAVACNELPASLTSIVADILLDVPGSGLQSGAPVDHKNPPPRRRACPPCYLRHGYRPVWGCPQGSRHR